MSRFNQLIFDLPNKPFSWKKIEAQFIERFWKKIKDKNWHFWKLSDMDIRKKPYDAILTFNNLDAKIEFKQSDNKKSVDVFKMLLPNQVRWLSQVQNNGWIALVIYYNTFVNKYRVKEYSEDLFISIE